MHDRLRDAVRVVRESAAADGSPGSAGQELLLYCWGFCQALSGHHTGEDGQLFPALEAQRPELGAVLAQLRQDHSMINYLLQDFAAAVETNRSPADLERHLDGLEAVMESHFRYEERQLLVPLEQLTLLDDPASVLGPLADRANPSDHRGESGRG